MFKKGGSLDKWTRKVAKKVPVLNDIQSIVKHGESHGVHKERQEIEAKLKAEQDARMKAEAEKADLETKLKAEEDARKAAEEKAQVNVANNADAPEYDQKNAHVFLDNNPPGYDDHHSDRELSGDELPPHTSE